MHYKADGSLDMRFSSSKAAFSQGLCDSHGCGFVSSSSSVSYSTPSYSSPSPSSSSQDYHTKADGSYDMRYSSSKELYKQGKIDKTGETLESNKKCLDPKYRTTGQTKHGSQEDGTDACHIVSHEVFNTVLQHSPGRMFSDRVQEQIARELNSDKNLRIKTHEGNINGKDGYSGDRYYDKMIRNALDSTDPKEKILTNQGAVDRMQRQWEKVQQLNLPPSVKQAFRDQFSQIKDQYGQSIVRANAPIDGYK